MLNVFLNDRHRSLKQLSLNISWFANYVFFLRRQLMWNNSSDAAGVVVVTRELLVVVLLSCLSLSLAFFHNHLDQLNVVFEAVAYMITAWTAKEITKMRYAVSARSCTVM